MSITNSRHLQDEHTERHRRAELLIVTLRWPALVVGITITADAVTPLALVAAGTLVTVYNTLLWHVARRPKLFLRHGQMAALAARALDLLVVAAASLSAAHERYDVYLLYVFVIVGAGYARGQVSHMLMALGAAVSLNLLVGLVHSSETQSLARFWQIALRETVVLSGSALVGGYLLASRRAAEHACRREDRLSRLLESTSLVAPLDEPQTLFQEIVETLLKESAAESVALFLRSDPSSQLTLTASAVCDPALPPLTADHPLVAHVAASGQSLLILPTCDQGKSAQPVTCRQAAMAAPLLDSPSSKAGAQVIGVLVAQGKPAGHQFTQEDLDLLRALAAKAALTVVNTTLYEQLRTSFLRVMQSLVRILEARDEYTRGHSQRVAELSRMIALELGLDGETIEMLATAALLHDIGKIGIPDGILLKTEKLSLHDWEAIWQHPVTSCKICRPLQPGEDVLFLIRHHHERLNGRGYPDRLLSHEQPLPLRILCAADAFDAMSTDRPYRRALDLAQRVEELNRCAGLEFDQCVVETLKSFMRQGRLAALYEQSLSAESADPLLSAFAEEAPRAPAEPVTVT